MSACVHTSRDQCEAINAEKLTLGAVNILFTFLVLLRQCFHWPVLTDLGRQASLGA